MKVDQLGLGNEVPDAVARGDECDGLAMPILNLGTDLDFVRDASGLSGKLRDVEADANAHGDLILLGHDSLLVDRGGLETNLFELTVQLPGSGVF